MKIALFSDIHGNLPALEAVLADIDTHDADVCYCQGDLVNFAPWPNEVIALLRARRIAVVQGNHDLGIGQHLPDFPFSFRSMVEQAAGWQALAATNAALTDDNRAYLRALPHNIRLDAGGPPPYLRVVLTHGSPADVNRYIQQDHDAADLLRLMHTHAADVLCMGHTHRPYHRVLPGRAGFRHALNLGSVGRPKDGDPRAAWCLLELTETSSVAVADSVRVQLHRVAYDYPRTVAAIRASAIPALYADALTQA